MNKRITFPERQAGLTLIETLIAILIFSFGVLGLVGYQVTATKLTSDAKNRSDAALLADELIGKMLVSDHSLVKTKFSSSPAGSEYTSWKGAVSGMLPGAASNPPTVTIDAQSGQVTIVLFWQAPYETTVHQYSVSTQLNL